MCTSEFITFASIQEQFATYNTELVGLSVDGLYSHIAWLRTIKGEINFRHMHDVEVTFPLVEDVSMAVVQKYGMIMPAEDSTKAVRAVFVIDPKCVVRAIIYYPLSLGRNFDELLRVIKALQAADHFELATPADWRPSEPVIVPPAGSCGTAAQRMSGQADGLHYENWLFCTTRRTAPASQRTYPPINVGDTVTDNERRHVANVRSSLWCSAGGIDLVGLGVHLRNGDVDTIERRTTPANNGPRTSSNMNRQPERLAGLPAGGRIRRMRMSAKAEYAVRAMIQLASVDSGALVKTDDLAKAQGIPPQFLVDILSDLRTDRLVRSHRGREGGYELAQPADEISIADVLRCIDGPLASVRDIDLGDLPYSGPTAALTDVWRALRASLRSVLEETSLADVAGGTLPEHVSMLADDYRAQEDRRGHGAQPAR